MAGKASGLENALQTRRLEAMEPAMGKSFEVLNQYTNAKENVKLGLYQRLGLAIGKFSVKESNRRYEGWSGELPFYVFKYRIKDGTNEKTLLMLDYKHSHDDHFHTDFRG